MSPEAYGLGLGALCILGVAVGTLVGGWVPRSRGGHQPWRESGARQKRPRSRPGTETFPADPVHVMPGPVTEIPAALVGRHEKPRPPRASTERGWFPPSAPDSFVPPDLPAAMLPEPDYVQRLRALDAWLVATGDAEPDNGEWNSGWNAAHESTREQMLRLGLRPDQ